MINSRAVFGALTFSTLIALLFAFYLQYVEGLFPCDLCLLQRFALICVGIIALVAFIHGPKRLFKNLYGLGTLLFSLLGLGFAARQVYLQSLPEELKPSCGAGMMYRLENEPWLQAIYDAMHGSGDCAKVDWTFLGQSLAFWTGALFLLFALLSVWALSKRQ